MSHRAIQRLRRELQGDILPSAVDGDDNAEDSSDDEDSNQPMKKSTVFAAGLFDDESDDDSDDDSEDDSDRDTDDKPGVEMSQNIEKDSNIDAKKDKNIPAQNNRHKKKASDAEDFDALLQEYKSQDADRKEYTTTSHVNPALVRYNIITSRMEVRDLDIENVRRSLFGGTGLNGDESSSRRAHRRNCVFGSPSDSWPRPPHYIGGGIGFKACNESKKSSLQTLPWPYCDMKEGDPRCPPLQSWFVFEYSDSYKRDYQDLQTIQDSGEINAMLLYIAHHPFVVEALLQISAVMYQMSQDKEGLLFLKRALWIYDCAASSSFLVPKNRCAFMDYQKDGNASFFSTLFWLVRVSYMGGLNRTALAASQFLLSLDPLRDPKNILLRIDHFALMCNTESSRKFLVDLVESDKLYVTFRDDESRKEFECQLLDLPNWGYSYALALFSLDDNTTTFGITTSEKANNALKTALCRFPSVISQLLTKNEVDVRSHSLRTDWPAVLEYLDDLHSQFQQRLYQTHNSDSVTRARTSQAYDTLVQIFVQQNCKLWSSSAVLTWIHDNLMLLKEEAKSGNGVNVDALSPTIMRYVNSDPIEYEDRFQTMPADANPIDPNIVAHAVHIEPNRRRFVQRNRRQANENIIDENGIPFAPRERFFLGRPREIVDPDLPLLELFWRSLLPWTHVEGVPPANR